MTISTFTGDTLDSQGYPTEEFLGFIKNYTYDTMPILNFLDILYDTWKYNNWGFILRKKYKNKRKLELHTGGWSGNEEIIRVLLENVWLTSFKMRYVKWEVGGHYYFEINCQQYLLNTKICDLIDKNNKIMSICKNCGELIDIYHATYIDRKFCSDKCKGEYEGDNCNTWQCPACGKIHDHYINNCNCMDRFTEDIIADIENGII